MNNEKQTKKSLLWTILFVAAALFIVAAIFALVIIMIYKALGEDAAAVVGIVLGVPIVAGLIKAVWPTKKNTNNHLFF